MYTKAQQVIFWTSIFEAFRGCTQIQSRVKWSKIWHFQPEAQITEIITSHGKPHNYKMQCLLVLIPVHIVIWANIMTQVGNLYWHEAQHLLLVLRTFLVGQYCKLDAPVDELQLSQFLQILKSVVLFERNSSSCWWLWSQHNCIWSFESWWDTIWIKITWFMKHLHSLMCWWHRASTILIQL